MTSITEAPSARTPTIPAAAPAGKLQPCPYAAPRPVRLVARDRAEIRRIAAARGTTQAAVVREPVSAALAARPPAPDPIPRPRPIPIPAPDRTLRASADCTIRIWVSAGPEGTRVDLGLSRWAWVGERGAKTRALVAHPDGTVCHLPGRCVPVAPIGAEAWLHLDWVERERAQPRELHVVTVGHQHGDRHGERRETIPLREILPPGVRWPAGAVESIEEALRRAARTGQTPMRLDVLDWDARPRQGWMAAADERPLERAA